VFKLNGSALTTWADRYTDREISGTTQAVFSNLKLAKDIEYKKDSTELYDASFRLQKENGEVKRLLIIRFILEMYTMINCQKKVVK